MKVFLVLLLALTCLVTCNYQSNIQQQSGFYYNYDTSMTPEQRQKLEEARLLIFAVVYVIVLSIFSIIGIVLACKCYSQKKRSDNIKSNMQVIRSNYASSLGLNMYQLNTSMQIPPTIHI